MVEHRPRYHFLPPSDLPDSRQAGWMNDPKLFFRKGEYHVFFQYGPAPNWRLKHWGHVVSADLVRWRWLPVALAPTPGGPDEGGCWTGCVIADRGRFHILYTGVRARDPARGRPQTQCLASSDDLIAWEKYAGNPVIAEKPAGFGDCFRDPCAWKEGDTWLMIIGSQVPGAGGAALLHRSKDLIHWEYMHPLFEGDPRRTGKMFECPDFFRLGEKWVLLTSCGKTWWHTGGYESRRFTAAKQGVTDGGNFYAAKTLADGLGRRILWGWITEGRSWEEQRKAGWSGVLSLPRLLTLLPDGGLGIEPAPELESLRGTSERYENVEVASGRNPKIRLLDRGAGDCIEISATFGPSDAAEYGVVVRCSPDLTEQTSITWRRDTERLVDTPLPLRAGEELTLRVFVDRSVIEVFANGRASHTLRAYPTREDSLGIGLFARGGTARLRSLDAWQMAPSPLQM